VVTAAREHRRLADVAAKPAGGLSSTGH